MSCDLNLGEDQRQILDAAAAMLAGAYPVSRRRNSQHDDLADIASFGALGLALPEAEGGAGFSLVEEALVHTLFGRHLVGSGALAAALAARLALAGGNGDLAQGIVSGEVPVCAALPSGDSLLLADGGAAGHALVFGDGDIALIEMSGQAREDVAGLGHGAPLQRLSAIGPAMIARSGGRALLDIRDLLVAAQLLGVAEAARDLAVEYAQVRQQFGQPIGGFQAIKHHCADMAIRAGMVSAQLDMAAIALRDGREDASFQAASLRLLAPRAALENARTSIQIHGGIGFSAEADAHHYLKHAHLLSRLGTPADMLAMPAPLSPYAPHGERI